MKAMIFAAGLGTRLAPLTNTVPKALVKIGNMTLIEILIRKLIRVGISEVIVNVHHFHETIRSFLQIHNNFGIQISLSDESGNLLETGGGIKKASWFFNDGNPFLVHNVDVISDINLEKMITRHHLAGNLATLAVRSRPSSRYLWFDKNMELCGWENTKTKEKVMAKQGVIQKFAFSGIHIIDPEIFPFITEMGSFSIIKSYLRLAENHSIGGFRHDESFWLDVGQPGNIAPATEYINSLKSG